MIELHIIETGKSYAPTDTYRIFHEHRKQFATKEEADAWIDETYGKSKRQKMYRDRKDAPPMVIGYVIGFRNADWSHSPVQKWLQQDWIEFRESKPLEIAA